MDSQFWKYTSKDNPEFWRRGCFITWPLDQEITLLFFKFKRFFKPPRLRNQIFLKMIRRSQREHKVGKYLVSNRIKNAAGIFIKFLFYYLYLRNFLTYIFKFTYVPSLSQIKCSYPMKRFFVNNSLLTNCYPYQIYNSSN